MSTWVVARRRNSRWTRWSAGSQEPGLGVLVGGKMGVDGDGLVNAKMMGDVVRFAVLDDHLDGLLRQVMN